MNLVYINGIVFMAALSGLAISAYILYKKTKKEILVCPLNFNCEEVLRSKYSSVFGVSIEIIGLCYYGFFALVYGVALAVPSIITPQIDTGLIIIASLAMIFSLYLFFVQVKLKEWCTWCLFSFVASCIIFACVVLV